MEEAENVSANSPHDGTGNPAAPASGPRAGGRWHADTAPATTNTRNTGPGRLLIAVYAIFAISATARAGYQILTKFSEAPLAYLLSAFAAVVYVVATVSLAKPGRTCVQGLRGGSPGGACRRPGGGGTERVRLGELPARDGVVPVWPRLRIHPAAAADPGTHLAVPPAARAQHR